jgi:hypothetical protein
MRRSVGFLMRDALRVRCVWFEDVAGFCSEQTLSVLFCCGCMCVLLRFVSFRFEVLPSSTY